MMRKNWKKSQKENKMSEEFEDNIFDFEEEPEEEL